jgi:hypothetical protein
VLGALASPIPADRLDAFPYFAGAALMTPVPETTVGDVPEMVEKVARALASAHGEDLDTMVFSLEELRSVPCWQVYASDARAAIAAMREPTSRMVNEGESAASFGIGKPNDDEAVPRVWFWMIDAALGNTEGAR